MIKGRNKNDTLIINNEGVLDSLFNHNSPKKKNTSEEYEHLINLYKSDHLREVLVNCYLKILELRIKSLGLIHPEIADSYFNLAEAGYSNGFFSESEKFYKKALEIRESFFGIGSNETTKIYTSLAYLYIKQKNFKQASLYYRKSLHIRVELFGDFNIDTANSYLDLAYFYTLTGEYNYSLPLFKKVLEIKESLLDKNHSEVISAYNDLSTCHYYLLQYKEAYSNLKKSINIRLLVDEKDEVLLGMKNNLGELEKLLPKDTYEVFWKKIKSYVA